MRVNHIVPGTSTRDRSFLQLVQFGEAMLGIMALNRVAAAMTTEYEHDGLIYHEPLPRIVLVNFPSAVNEELRARGHNSILCGETAGPNIGLLFPKPANEVDILLVRDSNAIANESGTPPVPTRTFHGGGNVKDVVVHTSLDKYRSAIWERGGTCVYFVGAPQCNLYSTSGFSNSIRNDVLLRPSGSAFRIVEPSPHEELKVFVERWRNLPTTMVGFIPLQGLHFTPLIEDASRTPLSYLISNEPHNGKPGFVLCLPVYGHEIAILDELLSQVLPTLAPHLFPFRHDLSWLKEKEFLSPGIKELETDKEAFRLETKRHIDALDERIGTIEKENQFLVDLLTCDGDKLKLAVKQGLEIILSHAGMQATVVDVDIDPSLRDGTTSKREDLRIELEGKSILINVAGREQFFRPTSLNQISRHHRMFVESSSSQPKNAHSLLFANYNYGKGLDPRKRGDMFSSGTAEAEQRLQAEGHGAISTFDLFRLVHACQAKEVELTQKHLTGLFTTVGILDFESFQAKLSRKA